MFKHYFSSALRNLRRRPLNTAIKLLALALGLVCLLTAHLIGDYFGHADSQWAKSDRTYVIVQDVARPGADWEGSPAQTSSLPVAKYLKTDIPELETVARMLAINTPARWSGQAQPVVGLPVDPEFLNIFDLEMVAGEASLDRPRTILISDEAATRIFGDEDPVGQTMTAEGGVDLTVTGVFRAFPAASHLGAAGQMTLHALPSFDSGEASYLARFPQVPRDFWERDDFAMQALITYVVLPADGSLTPAELDRRLVEFAERRAPQVNVQMRFRAIPISELTEIRFNDRVNMPEGISITMALYVLGLLTLAIGCVNFANLSAAEATTRAREIGLRKTVGATRRQVAVQMLVESGIVAGIALVLVLPLTGMVARVITTRFGLVVPMPDVSRLDYWGGVAVIGLLVALAAGVYPAMILSNLRPVFAMRAKLLRGGAGVVRSILIGGQFAAAAILVALVLVMQHHQSDLRATALRPNGDIVVTVPLPAVQTAAGMADRQETLREQLLSHPAVQAVTFRAQIPFMSAPGQASDYSQSLDPAARRFAGQARRVYYDYFSTLGVDLVAGRAFSRDRDETYSVIIDTATADIMGFSPEDAIGQPIYRVAATEATVAAGQTDPFEFTIIGVVEREPLELTAQGPTNFLYVLTPATGGLAIVRLSEDSVDAGLDHIRRTWAPMLQGQQANPIFLDLFFDQEYRAFSMINAVFMVLAGIAVIIAAMGLFAMASFVVQRRQREVGVRKTLGASTSRVLRLLIWDFSKPVLAANLIAWPIIWFAAQFYLNLFVSRSPLGPAPFLAALAFTLAIAWLAVGSQAWRAARTKPASVLKYE